jgi:hypothetical protein
MELIVGFARVKPFSGCSSPLSGLRFVVSLGFSNSCSHFHFVLEVAVASGETSWVDMWAVTTGSR